MFLDLPVPQLMWIAPNSDHYNLQTADRFDGIEVHQTGALIIHRVQTNDSGEYTCVATVGNYSVKAVMQLRVKEPERHVTIATTIQNVTV